MEIKGEAIQTASRPSEKATTTVRIVAQLDRPKEGAPNLGSTFVTVVKTTDTRPGDYLASAGAVHSTFRSLLPETTVGAVVVVLDIRGEQPFQMRFVEGNHLIEQSAPAATDPPLGNTILPRTTDGSSDGMDVHGANRAGYFAAILGVVVEEEKLGGRFTGEGFSYLLHDPYAGRMLRNIEVQNASSIMPN
jgi:hypothetical protein